MAKYYTWVRLTKCERQAEEQAGQQMGVLIAGKLSMS